MLARLIKFVILSRFSKPLLLFFSVFLLYDIFVPRPTQHGNTFFLFGSGMIALSLAVPVIAGGVAILKSDRDFLFLLPLNRFYLSLALLAAQFIAYGLMAFFLIGYYLPLSNLPLYFPILVFLSLGLAAASLSSIFYSRNLQTRLIFSLLIAGWCMLSVANFPFSPGSVFSENSFYGALSIFLLASISFPLAIISLSSSELGILKSFVLSGSKDVTAQKNFEGLSPRKAIFAFHFSMIEISGRLNVPGGAAYRTARISVWKATVVTSFLALVYFFISIRYNNFLASKFDLGTDPIIFISSIYITISPAFIGIVALGNERLWLGFTAVNPYYYLRNLSLAKALSLLTMLSPFVVSNLVLGMLGFNAGYIASIAIFFIAPSSLIIMVYFYGILSPLQIREDVYMAGQAGLKQVLGGLSVFLAIALTVVSFLGLYEAIVCALSLFFVAVYLLMDSKIAGKIIKSMVESGFV